MSKQPSPTRVLAAILVTGILAVLSARLEAQIAPPNISRPKELARNAVAATDAHTAAEQMQAPAPQAPAPKTVAPKPSAPAAAQTPTPGAAQRPAAGTIGGGSSSVSARGKSGGDIALSREVFSYEPDSRRDPFASLLNSNELRPMINDLRLVAVLYDPAGHSVAILRDLGSKEQYRVKVGQTLGRMRVAQIQPRSVVFTLEELGYSRQQILGLSDSTRVRTP
ncbi:MAG: pilus assembly protein PilP [Gemmatimonadota bacterium]|nr:pilus assembly protein PilP [Gemmatimonadota bacterium]